MLLNDFLMIVTIVTMALISIGYGSELGSADRLSIGNKYSTYMYLQKIND